MVKLLMEELMWNNIKSIFSNYKDHKRLEQKIKELEQMEDKKETRFDEILKAIGALSNKVDNLQTAVINSTEIPKLKEDFIKVKEGVREIHNMISNQ